MANEYDTSIGGLTASISLLTTVFAKVATFLFFQMNREYLVQKTLAACQKLDEGFVL